MLKSLKILQRCSITKPSVAFQALYNKDLEAQINKNANPKLDALVDVILSLNNRQAQYLNLLLTEQSLKQNRSIMSNKLINRQGVRITPLQYFYQQEWIKNQWKDTELLQFILSDQAEEAGLVEEAEAVKEHYDVELTSLDVAQKIKIIKTLRQMFGLGLKQAKDFADKVPSMLKKNMKREEAEKLKKDLDAVGCVITLK